MEEERPVTLQQSPKQGRIVNNVLSLNYASDLKKYFKKTRFEVDCVVLVTEPFPASLLILLQQVITYFLKPRGQLKIHLFE